MNTRLIIMVSVLLCGISVAGALAQEMKPNATVSQSYPGLGIDMQYYEIKYDPTNEDHVSYYKVIREKIMQKLKGLYIYHYRNGDVHLSFTIKSDGNTENFYVDRVKSVRDNTLVDIATKSLKRSSPFPKFPEEISSPKISFSVVISFKDK